MKPFNHQELVWINPAVKNLFNATAATPKNKIFYIYKIQKSNISQTGLLGLVPVNANSALKIHPHEQTILEKEISYENFLETQRVQSNPVFLVHKYHKHIDYTIKQITENKPETVFYLPNDTQHSIWKVNNTFLANKLEIYYQEIEDLYIADGHHRYSAARRVSTRLPRLNSMFSFLVSNNQVNIEAFNRLVEIPENISLNEFMNNLKEYFDLTILSTPLTPSSMEIELYINSQWYELKLKKQLSKRLNKLNQNGYWILDNYIFKNILNIKDQRFSKEISYLSGENDLQELEKKVDKVGHAAGFSLAPIDKNKFIDYAEVGHLLPPHSTYFTLKPAENIMSYLMEATAFNACNE